MGRFNNVSIPTSSQIPSPVSFITPKPSLQFKTNNRFYKFQNSHFKPFSYGTRFPLPHYSRRHISAQFGKRSSRQNSLRKKFTDNFQVSLQNPQIPTVQNDDNKSIQPDLVASEKQTGFESGNVTKVEGATGSVLWNRLEGWIEQYKKDVEFWGLGTGPIFNVYQDLNGNVKRVLVDENEILRRSGITTLEADESGEVSLKISHARFLAEEMERGNNMIPKSSSIVKFVSSGDNSRQLSGIGSSVMRFDFGRNVSRYGIVPLCGLLLVWAVKKFVSKEEGDSELKRLEKEMLRRKMKSRKKDVRFKDGSIEVVPEIIEPANEIKERPRLDKEELMNSIQAARQTNNEIKLLDDPSTRKMDSFDFEEKIQEIREMAMHAREAEQREHSPNEETLIEIETVDELPNSLKSESSAKVEDTSSTVIKETENSMGTDFAEVDGNMIPGEKGDQLLPTPSTSVRVHSNVEESSQIGRKERQSTKEVLGTNGSSNSIGPSTISKEASRKKPRVIRSVAEAREYLSDKPNPKISNGDLLEDHMHESQSSNGFDEVREDNKTQSDRLSGSLGEEYTVLDTSNPSNISPSTKSSHKRTSVSYSKVNGLNRKAPKKSVSSASAHDSAKDEGTADTKNTVRKEKKIHDTLMLDKSIDASESGESMNACQDSRMKEDDGLRPEINVINIDARSSAVQSKSVHNSSCHEDADYNSDHKKNLPEIVKPAGSGESDIVNAVNVSDDNSDLNKKHSFSDELNNHDVSDENHAVQAYADDASEVREEYGEELKVKASSLTNNWLEKNFDELKPVLEKIGSGFGKNYEVAREKVKQEDTGSDLTQLMSALSDNTELEWMNDDNLREIVFKVRDNEIAGRDPFHSMDDEDKITFFKGLEEKVEKESNKLSGFHEWLHSNIENLDYGADGISVYDPPEKIIPRWKGAPFEKIREFLANTPKAQGDPALMQPDLPVQENLNMKVEVPSNNVKPLVKVAKKSKTVIESSDGSVKPGRRNGKEQWQHTKKYTRGFMESFNAENDPEVKEVMKDIGKDLDKWITEEEIKKAANPTSQLRRRSKAFVEKQISKIKSEVEQFGTQAVLSKYREYTVEEEEDYLWWLDLPYVLCIELYTQEGDEMKVGFYTLEMAADLELEPKPYHVIAFEEPSECKNLCYIIQSHLEIIGKDGKAFVVAQPPKDAFRDAKGNGFGVTVIRKGELSLDVDQPLEEVEELITEIGSKMYHDKIMKERSVDMRSVMKGVIATSKPTKRKNGKRQGLRKPKN